MEQLLDYVAIYEFSIGIILTKNEFETYGDILEAEKLFVFKGFSEGLCAHYLPK